MTLEEVEALEQARIAAMLDSDVPALERLMSDELRWTHGSGKVEGKQALIANFAEGTLRVFKMERVESEARVFGTAAVVNGIVCMDAQAGDIRKEIHSRYAGVWSDHDGTPQVVNWQSARVE